MRRLLAAAAVTAAVAAPFAQPASAVCESHSPVNVVRLTTCGASTSWLWCASAGVSGVAGVSACQPTDQTGIWVGCWTWQGLHCN